MQLKLIHSIKMNIPNFCTVCSSLTRHIPIQSDEIVMGEYYSVAARGNTCHYLYDDVERVELRINMYVNMNETPKDKKKTTEDDKDHEIFN